VFLVGFKFLLVKADEYTEKYMEDNAQNFPEADVDGLIKKIKAKGADFPSLQEYAIHLIKALDTNNNGVVDIKEFSEGLKKMGIYASKHEEHTLMRKFDETGEAKISMEGFYNCLAKEL
jgi:Ca2+-binding EF-hand superfamily protein